LRGTAPDNAKQGVLTHWQKKAACEALPRPAAQREAEMVNQSLQPRRPACEGAGYCRIKPLSEDLLTAIGQDTTEPACLDFDPNLLSLGRKVRQQALITAVDLARRLTARPADR